MYAQRYHEYASCAPYASTAPAAAHTYHRFRRKSSPANVPFRQPMSVSARISVEKEKVGP